MNHKKMVLVTGGTGFIAVHIIAKLLQRGYRVRTTLRNMQRVDEVLGMVKKAGVENADALEFAQADLLNAADWDSATKGATYVIHVASPTPATRPDSGEAMVKMAVAGVQNVFVAAQKAGVQRIVLTSASGAVLAGHGKRHPELFTEADWTNLQANIDPYQRSKTMAEQAAWQFADENNLELATVLPTTVMGPLLGQDFSHSQIIIKNMLAGKAKRLLKLGFDVVDVRDVADLHILAMETPQAKGERFLATTGENLTFKQEAQILIEHLGPKATRVSTREMANLSVKFIALFDKSLRMPASLLGGNMACSNAKAKQMFDWQPISASEAILATAQSMLDLGVVE